MSALSDALDYYSNLLVLQYRTKPKAAATIQILVKQAIADLFTLDLQTAFDLNTAVGAQLDVLGKYIGVPRNSNTGAAPNYYGYADYAGGGSIFGLNDYSSGSPNGFVFDDYAGSSLPTTDFSDVQYRFVLFLQIALNNFDGTLAYIQQFLADFFPGQITVVDNLNMSLTYHVGGDLVLPIPGTVLQNFLPRPMGCGISVVIDEVSNTRITSDGATRVTTDGAIRKTVLY